METGITVNVVTALVYENKFAANHVPLEDGNNDIIVTGTNADGYTATASVSVNADTSGEYIRITLDEESGVAPFETTLSLDASFHITEDPQFSYSGPDSISMFRMDDGYNYTVTINAPGLYYITATVENDSSTCSDTIAILVMDAAMLDALLKAKWNGMKTALTDGDIEKALSYHNKRFREEYESIYNFLGNNLSVMAQEMKDIEVVFIEGNRAKYAINRDHNIDGQIVTITYFIYFSRGKDGIWKIEKY